LLATLLAALVALVLTAVTLLAAPVPVVVCHD
jgi:hypothetical protein